MRNGVRLPHRDGHRGACLMVAVALLLGTNQRAAAEESFDPQRHEPADPLAAVDGDPVRIGEMNLVLGERLGVAAIDEATDTARRATALLLVRRRLAMRSLRESGGAALQALIERKIELASDELRRRSSTLAEHAQARRADEKSFLSDLSWKIAWGHYVRSKLTEENLRRFFGQHADRYGGGSFADLTDHARLRRDATSALFDHLVRKQQAIEVQWFIPALQPPEGVPVIPAS